MTIAQAEAPFAAALISGAAAYHEGEQWIDEEIRRITARYLTAQEVAPYIERWSDLRGMVTVQPEAVRSWGRRPTTAPAQK